MDPRTNPYTPNAGAQPPVLAGRSSLLDNFSVLMNRLKAGRTDKSMVITGLRGVGKTVLLGVFRKNADDSGWVTLESEISKHDDMAFGKMIAKEMRRALFSLDPARKWAKRARRAAGVLRSFSLTVDPGGSLSVGLDVERMYGTADSGQLDSNLTDLFVALGEAAWKGCVECFSR